jgi:D-tyrosyl-tRNA(Tyr) deacylase
LRIVLQRVHSALVKVDDEIISRIGKGFLILLGAEIGDTHKQVEYLAEKCVSLRVFEDEKGKMNLALADINGEMLVVSQFTLCADLAKGRRPSFDNALPPAEAKKLYNDFCTIVSHKGIPVQTGSFGAKMAIELVNDGPVTLVLEN